ncbi:unnamed protein product [Paramecium primaurelia]|uniref:Uncharacterized protein n=1 Tax=Paramecium primaurelia TaxID=5886 RepID=A0A8S1N0R8_PARPR|nr:unnamed protein product [Paramecium primaurelia]
MRSADLKNIIVNHAPNHHSKNPGWEYFPSSQIKCQVEAAQKKELAKPTPPSIKIKTLELKAKYIDKTKPKHIFKKTDLKEIAKKKRDELQNWITEENNLKKGIQKQHKCKPAPSVKEDEPNDQWPDMNDNQQENNNQNEEQEEQEDNNSQQEEQNESVKNKKLDEEEQDQQENQEEQDQQDQQEEQNQQEEQQYQQNDYEQEESQKYNESKENSKLILEQSNQKQKSQSSNKQKKSQSDNQSNINLEINDNKSEVKSIVSNSFVKNQSKVINKSVNTSSLLFYKSQVADQMRSLMDDFE